MLAVGVQLLQVGCNLLKLRVRATSNRPFEIGGQVLSDILRCVLARVSYYDLLSAGCQDILHVDYGPVAPNNTKSYVRPWCLIGILKEFLRGFSYVIRIEKETDDAKARLEIKGATQEGDGLGHLSLTS